MSSLPYPRGAARAIADARANGLKPAGVVLIVLAGHFDWPDPMVYATPGQSYRWDWLKGLSAVLLIDSKTRIGEIVSDIERAEPFQLDVIDAERRLGWLVNWATPQVIKTVRWPRFMVDDWLGTGDWHRELERIKASAVQAAEAKRQAKPTFEPEAVWN
jgi:hypothetical protein